MNTNLFSNCNTNAEIMRRLFELSSNTGLSRAQIIIMSNERRKELEASGHTDTKFSSITPVKEIMDINQSALKLSQLSTNYMTSDTVIFLGDHKVMF